MAEVKKCSQVQSCPCCSRPMELRRSRVDDKDYFIWYCPTVKCGKQGAQYRILADMMNGGLRKAQAMGLYKE